MKQINSLLVVLLFFSSSLHSQNYVSRVPVYEMFTSSTCGPCRPANDYLTPIFEKARNKAVIIKYQMSWPGTGDPYFTGSGNGRRNGYGINSVPQFVRYGQKESYSTFTETRLAEDLEDSARMEMELRYLIDADSQMVKIRARVKALDSFDDGAHRLVIAIVERHTEENRKSNGESEFFDVFKLMLPTSTGDFIVGQILPGDTFAYNIDYKFPGDYRLPNNANDRIDDATEHSVENFDSLHVVMFMQTAASSKEIYQGCVGTLERHEEDFNRPWGDPFLGNDLPSTEKLSLNIYPNPVTGITNSLNVSINRDIRQIALTAIDGSAVYVDNQIVGDQASVNVGGLSNGLYVIQVITDGAVYSEKILVQR